jgi:anti-sigma factor RsiW
MMECAKIKKLLPAHSVGALSKRNRKLVKRHIDSCPECKLELMRLEKTASLLALLPQEEPPDFLWEEVRIGIMRCASEPRQERPVKTPFWREVIEWLKGKRIPALAGSLAILALVASLYFFIIKRTLRVRTPTEPQPSLYAEVEQQVFSSWNSPFADRAALGMIVIKTSLEGDINETVR